MVETAFFYAFAALTLLGALLTVTLRNAIHCAISLITSLAGVAGLYLLLQAEFLFAVQIILYIGGIMVLFLFVIMLVNLDQEASKRQYHRQWLPALACVVGTGSLVVAFFAKGSGALKLNTPPAAPHAGGLDALSLTLFREYLVPFEVASLLLLVAIVGSVLMAKKRSE